MRLRVFVCAVAMVLASCADVSSQKEGIAYQIKRNAYNELSIRVDQAPKGQADLVLFRLQGREQARDAFLSMDWKRRAGLGMLSEISSEEHAFKKDREIVAIGLRHAAQRKHDRLKAEFPLEYSYLQAFADGVNEYLAEVREKQHDLESPERRMLEYYWDESRTGDRNYFPEAWHPLHSVAIFQSVAFYLSSALPSKLPAGVLAFHEQRRHVKPGQKLLRWARIQSESPTEMTEPVRNLLDPRPIYKTFILDADKKQNPWRTAGTIEPGVAPPRVSKLDLPKFPYVYRCREMGFPIPECPETRGMSVGSNSWVVSEAMSGTGASYLANDPHLQMGYPMNFYLLALDSTPAADPDNRHEGFKGRGMHVVGLPGWLIGSNQNFAWGFTNFGADVDDVYLEKVTKDGKSVEFAGGNVRIVSERVTIRRRLRGGGVKDEPVMYRYVPHHGPIISDGMPDLQDALVGVAAHYGAPAMVASYRWTGHEASWTQLKNARGRGGEIVGQLRINRASNFTEFKEAIHHIVSGMQNIVYADTKGNIGYYTDGLLPKRPYASQWLPLYPVMGQGNFEWAGDYRTKMPELFNPSSGRIVTANNDPFGSTEEKPLEDYIGFFSTSSRAKRITEALEAKRGHIDMNAMAKVQFDHVDRTVTAFTGVLYARGRTLGFAPDTTEQELFDSLTSFQGDMDRNENTPVLVDSWLNHLQDVFIERHFDKALHEAARYFRRRVELVATMYHKLHDHTDDKWVEEVFRESIVRAARDVEEKNLRSYRWGEVHKVGFWNPLDQIAKLPFVANFPRDGYYETPDVAGPTFGPNFRLIQKIRRGKPIEMTVSVPGGNYDPRDREKIYSEFGRWLDGEYRPFVDNI